MSFSVIIPSKTASNLVSCVEAVRKHEPDARVIVVDDGLDWAEAEADAKVIDHCWLCGVDPALRIQGVKPFIFARNVNLGIRVAETDDVVLLNDDALLQTPRGFGKLAQFAEDHPEVGCVAPATNITGQPLQWPQNRAPQGYRYVDCVPYVCVYLPRRTLDTIGLLDERYCLDYGMEDRDHCEAMTRAGLKIAVLYDVYVDHGSLVSSFRGDPKQPKRFDKNYALFKAKWGIR